MLNLNIKKIWRQSIACLIISLLVPTAGQAQEFPVKITHSFGLTAIDTKPKRVISLSYIGHDFLLALGVKPLALRFWYGAHPYGVWPWAKEALGDHKPVVMRGEIDIEQIALLAPDLIVGLWSGMTKDDYRLLSMIAPTIAPESRYGDYGTPWQVMTRTLGHATGQDEKADELVADIESRFTKVRDAHPDWQGRSIAIVWPGQLGVYTSNDIRSQFFESLGFVLPETINRLGSEKNFYVQISGENLDPIDTDVLIWVGAGSLAKQLKKIPLRATMRAPREGREIYVSPLLFSALSHSSPLSLGYALDKIIPLLEQAVDGDPKTVVENNSGDNNE